MKLLIFILLLSPFSFCQIDGPNLDLIHKQLDSLQNEKNKVLANAEKIKLSWIQEHMDYVSVPLSEKSEQIIHHSAFNLSYNEEHEQANWVMHVILKDVVEGNFSRSNDFREDSMIVTGSAQEKDYFTKVLKSDNETYKYDGYGYDRGHLAPSADFKWSQKALSESYFYSNMSPQAPDFNREIWATLENRVRNYVELNDVNLVVVTAPILNDELTKIERSPNGLSLPEFYIKAILDIKNKRAIAFQMPNRKVDQPLESYAISIDSVETVLNYDLFSGLDDQMQVEIEREFDIKFWLTPEEKNDVIAIDHWRLPKSTINTYSAKSNTNSGKKHTVCGTVVGAKKHQKGHVFIDVDKKFPNQIFSVSIFESELKNFSYQPEVYLLKQEVCFIGEIANYKNTPNMVISNEKQIKLLEEY